MSLDKAIEHGKEHRRPYFGAKAVDKTCRNHGACVHCAMGRKHQVLKKLPIEDIREIESLINFKDRYRRAGND